MLSPLLRWWVLWPLWCGGDSAEEWFGESDGEDGRGRFGVEASSCGCRPVEGGVNVDSGLDESVVEGDIVVRLSVVLVLPQHANDETLDAVD